LVEVYTPKFFVEGVCEDYNLYKWAAHMVATRAFGWNIPHTTLIPLVDMFNHTSPNANNGVDLFHRKLHLVDNKIYQFGYVFDIDEDGKTVPRLDEEDDSKRMSYNVTSIYESLGKATPDIATIISGPPFKPGTPGDYSEEEVFSRFQALYEFENSKSSTNIKLDLVERGDVSEKSYEEAKRDYLASKGFKDCGI